MQPSIVKHDLIMRLAEEIPTDKDDIDMFHNGHFFKHNASHEHVFIEINFSMGLRSCEGCHNRLKPAFFSSKRNGDEVSGSIVRCTGCGIYAHKICTSLLLCQPIASEHGGSIKDIEYDHAQNKTNDIIINHDEDDDSIIFTEFESPNTSGGASMSLNFPDNNEDNLQNEDDMFQHSQNSATSFLRGLFSRQNSQVSQKSDIETDLETAMTSEICNQMNDEVEQKRFEASMVWTDDGPPLHWADSSKVFGGSTTSLSEPVKLEFVIDSDAPDDEVSPQKQQNEHTDEIPGLVSDDDDDESEAPEVEPIKVDFKTFGNFARTFQESFFVYFREQRASLDDERSIVPKMNHIFDIDDLDTGIQEDDSYDECAPLLIHSGAAYGQGEAPENWQRGANEDDNARHSSGVGAITPHQYKQRTLGEFATSAYSAYQAILESPVARRKLEIAMVASGLVGVAGLMVAGPVGAYIGSKFCQTLFVVSGILDNTVAVGVLVAINAPSGLKGTRHRKVLEFGNKITNQKILLVRPQVEIDPEWTNICDRAKSISPVLQKAKYYLSVLSASPLGSSPDTRTRVDRYQRDVDIVTTNEEELATDEKVLLLASRILNDKLSLPGHVFRELIAECWRRDTVRQAEDGVSVSVEVHSESTVTTELRSSDRCRRQDVHAVIIHVTATLLEVRPAFSASATVTDMTATAVEGLVFGELYKMVFEEIMEETRSTDEALITKFMAFDKIHPTGPDWDDISFLALASLAEVPQCQTPVDKLHFFVLFLEHISTHFLEASKKRSNGSSSSNNIGADSLLRIVCEHLLVAKVPYLNAEIVFLEEFARDERLLRGKEGYALVTMQAAVHFLNQSTDLDRDIFEAIDE